ncbi:MAG: sugar transferase [Phycisphaerae bacterium]|nr:sugar transferase [Phycisphaerae bacterium]
MPWTHPAVPGIIATVYPAIKRLLDFAASLILIVVLIPVWLLVALAVRLSSPGPVFFLQERGGLRGHPIRVAKFRTMYADHVHDPTEVVPLSHSRITPVGRILRRAKIDELPQLFSVLRGDMSLVGPRPTIMEQIRQYDALRRRRLEVRPGIAGLAQVNGNTAISWDERIRYDIYYVDHMSFGLDLMILCKTAMTVIFGEAAFARPFDQSPFAETKP